MKKYRNPVRQLIILRVRNVITDRKRPIQTHPLMLCKRQNGNMRLVAVIMTVVTYLVVASRKKLIDAKVIITVIRTTDGTVQTARRVQQTQHVTVENIFPVMMDII